MNLENILLAGFKTYYCAACKRKTPEYNAKITSDRLCICSECMENADKYKSSAVFKGNNYLSNVIAAYPYSGILKSMFGRYKFRGEWGLAEVFSKLLIQKAKPFIKKDDFDLLVPVPLSGKRMLERGYNQSALMGKPFAEYFGIEYSAKALFRIKNTKRQSELASNQRNKNVYGAFLAEKKAVEGKKILLLDDIYTVGATMGECARTLLLSSAKQVSGICLFKTPAAVDLKEPYTFKN